MQHRINKLLIILLVGLIIPSIAQAQTASRVTIISPDMSEFPTVSAYLDLRDDVGDFVPDLGLQDVVALEDGIERPLSELQEIQSDLRLVFALNSGSALYIRDLQGNSRMDMVGSLVKGWVTSLDDSHQDSFSLVTSSGTLVSHTADIGEWLTAWDAETSTKNAANPTLDVLARAVDLASEPADNPEIGRVVFFITPTFPFNLAANLQDITDRALDSGVRIYVLVVDSPVLFIRTSAQELRSMTFQTGGRYEAFSGTETLPNLIGWMSPARSKYHFSYRSQFNTPGEHTLAVRIQSEGVEYRSEDMSINLRLQPPNPVFLSLPGEIVRTIPNDLEPVAENLFPNLSPLEVLFDFPDGMPRQIVRSILYVNGEAVIEKNEPPFDRFALDLTPYEASQRILVRVEAWDEIGLIGASLDNAVDIVIQPPEQTIWSAIMRNGPFMVVGVISITGAILLLVLVLAGRVRPQSMGERSRRNSRKRDQDPVTQPVDAILNGDKSKPSPLAKFARRLPTRRGTAAQKPAKEPLAYLVRITENGEVEPGKIISVLSKEVTFGSNPIQATIVLEDPAVEELHARLFKNGDGGFYLADQDSVAGTWINYAPVKNGGVPIQHGDLLHIAKIGFRFTLHKPEKVTKPVVTPLKEVELE